MLHFYFNPNGRVSRKAIWLRFFLPGVGIFFFAGIMDALLGWDVDETVYGPVSLIVFLIIFWPSIAVTIKRFHDRNMTGWWIVVFASFSQDRDC